MRDVRVLVEALPPTQALVEHRRTAIVEPEHVDGPARVVDEVHARGDGGDGRVLAGRAGAVANRVDREAGLLRVDDVVDVEVDAQALVAGGRRYRGPDAVAGAVVEAVEDG